MTPELVVSLSSEYPMLLFHGPPEELVIMVKANLS
jgi:hypothetical protein